MQTLTSLSNDLADAVGHVAPAVFTVHARRRLPSTGVHWRAGVVVTADHTVRAEEVTVTTADGRSLAAAVAGRDPGTDLAVLTVDGAGPSTAPLGDAGTLRVGHLALAVGYGPRASLGVIGALGPAWRSWRGGEIDRLVRPDLVLYPGFSGGPLVDASGRVVALVTSGLAREATLAIPAVTVARVVEEILKRGHVARGYLGLGMQPVRLPEAVQRELGVTRDTGLIVVTVEADGPAARAGVLLGDILIALDGAPVSDLDDVQAQLGGAQIGRTSPASVIRAGARAELAITVGEQARRRA